MWRNFIAWKSNSVPFPIGKCARTCCAKLFWASLTNPSLDSAAKLRKVRLSDAAAASLSSRITSSELSSLFSDRDSPMEMRELVVSCTQKIRSGETMNQSGPRMSPYNTPRITEILRECSQVPPGCFKCTVTLLILYMSDKKRTYSAGKLSFRSEKIRKLWLRPSRATLKSM